MPPLLEVRTVIESPWNDVPPIRIGPVSTPLRTPDRYVVGKHGQRDQLLRVDVYFDQGEYNFKVAAETWCRFIAIAVGESLYLIEPSDGVARRIALQGNFCEFAVTDHQLIIASAEQLLAIDCEGQVVWRSEPLGIDGVVIGAIAGTTIRGSGEWDPPGGWQDFEIALESGQRVG